MHFSRSLLNWGMAFPRFVSTTKLDGPHYAMQHWEDIRRCWKRYWASAQIRMRLCENLALARRWWTVGLFCTFVFDLGTMRPCEFSYRQKQIPTNPTVLEAALYVTWAILTTWKGLACWWKLGLILVVVSKSLVRMLSTGLQAGERLK